MGPHLTVAHHSVARIAASTAAVAIYGCSTRSAHMASAIVGMPGLARLPHAVFRHDHRHQTAGGWTDNDAGRVD